jgi:hypothetical protein
VNLLHCTPWQNPTHENPGLYTHRTRGCDAFSSTITQGKLSATLSQLPLGPCLLFLACFQTPVARSCTMLQHRLPGCRTKTTTTSGRRAAIVSAPRRAPLRVCCSAPGLAAVHGPSFESLDSDDLLSPLATGVRQHAVRRSFSVVSTESDQKPGAAESETRAVHCCIHSCWWNARCCSGPRVAGPQQETQQQKAEGGEPRAHPSLVCAAPNAAAADIRLSFLHRRCPPR